MSDRIVYRLEIPQSMILIVPSKTRSLNHKHVEIADESEEVTVINPITDKTDYHHVKRYWLKPIDKDEFDDWLKQRAKEYPDINITDGKGCLWEDKDMRDCYEWTKGNERKKYQPLIDWASQRMKRLSKESDTYDVNLGRILKDLKIEWR